MMPLALDAVRPGMALARAIVNDAGVSLFGKGTVITESVIERLRSAGVTVIPIEARRSPKSSRDEELRLLDERFAHVREAPHMSDIREMVRRHIESLYS
jgi:hypothetical protein